MDVQVILILISFVFSLYLLITGEKFIYFEISALISIILHGSYIFGYKIIYILIIGYIFSTVAELLSLNTKFNIFGVKYQYNLHHKMFSSQINYLKIYPLEVSFGWVIFNYLAFSAAIFIINYYQFPYGGGGLIHAFIFVAIDLLIDPVAVQNKMWNWKRGSKYFGIPLSNFLGWFFVGYVSSTISYQMIKNHLFYSHWLMFLPVISLIILLPNMRVLFRVNKKNSILGGIPLMTIIMACLVILLK